MSLVKCRSITFDSSKPSSSIRPKSSHPIFEWSASWTPRDTSEWFERTRRQSSLAPGRATSSTRRVATGTPLSLQISFPSQRKFPISNPFRFYRCVKFNQEVEDYSVFEFDCPAGLSFDERTEVCVWPGSMPEGSPCPGSSEIAPVPRVRFECPSKSGYYADPQNPRWFFACVDLGLHHFVEQSLSLVFFLFVTLT